MAVDIVLVKHRSWRLMKLDSKDVRRRDCFIYSSATGYELYSIFTYHALRNV